MKNITIKKVVDEHEVYNSKGEPLGIIYPSFDSDEWKYDGWECTSHTVREIKDILYFMETVLGEE